MIHWTARRYLAAIPDATLPGPLEARVLRHAQGCSRCRRQLREHRAAESLLQRIPASLIPLGGGAAAEVRLSGLIRWAPEPTPPVGRWRAPALGLAAALVAVMLQLSLSLPVTPAVAASEPWIEVAAVSGEPGTVGAMAGWR
jgi:hypothetical protein